MIKTNNGETLTEIIENLTADIEGDQTTVAHLVEQFRYRSFGPLLVIPALIVILPTGAIPMIPAICGLLMAFICAQVVIGKEQPWIPEKLAKFSISKNTLEKTIKKITPYTRILDRLVYNRWPFLVGDISKRLSAAFCFLLCLVMIMIGFIPMLPAAMAFPVFFFGLAFLVKDGILVLIGTAMAVAGGLGLMLLFSLF